MNDQQKIPEIKLIPVEAVENPNFLPMRESVSDEKLKDLRESIKNHGLKYPILVRPGSKPDTFELKDGFLRLRCVRALGWIEVLAEVSETSDENVVVESLITNKDRMDEDPITVAKKLDILVNKFGWTQEKVAEELGMSREWVSNGIRLLRLPEEIQHSLSTNNVSGQHGVLLLSLENPELQKQLAKEVVEHHLSTVELQHKIWDAKTMPHLHTVPIPHPQSSGGGPEPVSTYTAQCSNPGCLKMLYENEIVTIDQKPYCRACAPDIHVQKVNEEAKSKPVSPKSLDTWEQKKANMSPHDSQFQQEVFVELASEGLTFETNVKLPVVETEPDGLRRDVNLLVYLDNVEIHKGKRSDKDEQIRELFKKHHPEVTVLGIPFTGKSDKEKARVKQLIREKYELLKGEEGKFDVPTTGNGKEKTDV